MPSVNFSFPVKTLSHNISVVNYLNKLLTWKMIPSQKRSTMPAREFPSSIFYEVKAGKWWFTKQKQAFLSLNKLTNIKGASIAKDSLERKHTGRFQDMLLVG